MNSLQPTTYFARRLRQTAGRLLGTALSLLALPAALRAEDNVITAVAAHASDDYVRPRQADGKFEPESYTFGEGGIWSGAQTDASIDKLKFIDIARTIALPLADQNYLPGRDPNQIKFLIMVYWGTTIGAGSASSSVAYQNFQATQHAVPPPPPPPTGKPGTAIAPGVGDSPPDTGETDAMLTMVSMENRNRDQNDAKNAALLGYDSEGVIGTDYGRNIARTGLARRAQDLVEEVEENRYFVVLMAYDFQLLRKEKKHKLVWETRFSIRQRGNDFDKQLAAMAQYASRYFGRDSHGLVRKPLPETSINLGELKIIGVEPDKK